jgi:hypothetical protein
MKPLIKIALFVIFFLTIAGIGAALYLLKMGHKDLKNVVPDFIISASDLQRTFEDNESEATVKYVNKILEVNGIVESASPGEANVLNVTLKTSNNFSSIICTFPSAIDPHLFTPDTQVKIRGECSGFLMDVLLNNCVLIK